MFKNSQPTAVMGMFPFAWAFQIKLRIHGFHELDQGAAAVYGASLPAPCVLGGHVPACKNLRIQKSKVIFVRQIERKVCKPFGVFGGKPVDAFARRVPEVLQFLEEIFSGKAFLFAGNRTYAAERSFDNVLAQLTISLKLALRKPLVAGGLVRKFRMGSLIAGHIGGFVASQRSFQVQQIAGFRFGRSLRIWILNRANYAMGAA